MERENARAAIDRAAAELRNSYEPQCIEPYQYWGRVSRIVDADTLDLDVDLGFNTCVSGRFRLLGLNAPEIFGVRHDSDEYRLGSEAMEFVCSLLSPPDWVEVMVFQGQREKYGRWLCEVFIDGESLNEQLLITGHAIPV